MIPETRNWYAYSGHHLPSLVNHLRGILDTRLHVSWNTEGLHTYHDGIARVAANQGATFATSFATWYAPQKKFSQSNLKQDVCSCDAKKLKKYNLPNVISDLKPQLFLKFKSIVILNPQSRFFLRAGYSPKDGRGTRDSVPATIPGTHRGDPSDGNIFGSDDSLPGNRQGPVPTG